MGLACFRLAVLLSEDSGPGHLISKLRSFLKREAKTNKALRKTYVQEGVDCLRCSSVWWAAPVAAYAVLRDQIEGWPRMTADGFLLWMALSAMAILLSRIPKR